MSGVAADHYRVFMQEEGSPVSLGKSPDNPSPPNMQPTSLAPQDKECSLPLNQIQREKSIPTDNRTARAADHNTRSDVNGKQDDLNGKTKDLPSFVPDLNDLELDLSEGSAASGDLEKHASKILPRPDPQFKRPEFPKRKGYAPAAPQDKALAEVIDISDDGTSGASLTHREGQQDNSRSDSDFQIMEPPVQTAIIKGTDTQQEKGRKQIQISKEKQLVQQAEFTRKDNNDAKQAKKQNIVQKPRGAANKKGKKNAGDKLQAAQAVQAEQGPTTRRQKRIGKAAAAKAGTKKAAVNASKAAKEKPPDWLTDDKTAVSVSS